MPNQGITLRHAKARGEWAELRFMTRAAEQGLRVTKPWGDNAPYDLAIDSHGHASTTPQLCHPVYNHDGSVNCFLSTRRRKCAKEVVAAPSFSLIRGF